MKENTVLSFVPTDTVKSLGPSIAQHVLDFIDHNRVLESSFRYSDRERLQSIADGSADDSGNYLYFIFEYWPEGPRDTVDFTARLSRESDRLEDSEGNLWRSCRVESKINWPSYGSMEPSLADRRIQLMLAANELAKSVEAKFHDTYYALIQTHEQREQYKQVLLAQLRTSKYKELLAEDRKRMRVGSDKRIILNLEKMGDIAPVPGTLALTWDDEKKYQLEVLNDVDENLGFKACTVILKRVS